MFKSVETSIREQEGRIAATQAEINGCDETIAELLAEIEDYKALRKQLKKRLRGQKTYLQKLRLVGRGTDVDIFIANAGALA